MPRWARNYYDTANLEKEKFLIQYINHIRKSKAAFLCIHSSNEQIINIPISTRIICFQCSSPMETTFSNGYDTHRVN
jgi:hypothetical protein